MRIIQAKTLGKAMEISSKYIKTGRGVRIIKKRDNYEVRIIAKLQN